MRQKEKQSIKMIVSFIACSLLLGLGVFSIFRNYQQRLNTEFDSFIRETLTTYAEAQGNSIQSLVSDIEGTLKAVTVLVENQGSVPDGSQLSAALKLLSDRESSYQIQYFTRDFLLERKVSEEAGDVYRQTVEQLILGNTVISPIGYAEHQSESYIFSIGVPIMQNGEMVGALRSVINVKSLLAAAEPDKLNRLVNTWIVDQEGTAVYAYHEIRGEYHDLFSLLEANRIPGFIKNQIRSTLAEEKAVTCLIHTEEDGPLYMSVAPVGVNGWFLVNFTQEKETSVVSANIMNSGIEVGMLLILVTVIAAAFFYSLILRQRRSLNLEQKRYAALSRFSDTILFDYHWEEDTIEFTDNALKVIPLKTAQLANFLEVSTLASLIHPDDFETLYECFKNPPRGTSEPAACEIRLIGKDHRYHWYSCQYQPVYEIHKYQPSVLIGKLADIDDQKKKEEELRLKSSLDGLTGVLNKQTAEAEIQKKLDDHLNGCLFMLDIDDFKEVNDQQGHVAGDHLLEKIGKLLKTNFRQNDLIGRIGGDEFVVFLETSNPMVLHRKAEQLVKSLSQLTGEEGYPVSVSIGAAITHKDTTYHALFERADQAMYQAKLLGKNQYRFDDTLGE